VAGGEVAATDVDLSVEICGMRLDHPVLNGSGTFDAIAARRAFGDAIYEQFPFAAFVSKTVTLEPRQGNPPPRLWESPAGMINSIGLPNKGLEGFLASDLPELAELPVPLIVSVMGFSRAELATLVRRVGERDEVALIELNVSCPNVETGLVMGADPAETARAVATSIPFSRNRRRSPSVITPTSSPVSLTTVVMPSRLLLISRMASRAEAFAWTRGTATP
jgi:dihydroorotate dehydrogenase (NAD+) catalytic subunit